MEGQQKATETKFTTWLKSESYRRNTVLALVILVMGTGAALSFTGIPSAFQRSGAVLVVFTLILAGIDLRFKFGEIMNKELIANWKSIKQAIELESEVLKKQETNQPCLSHQLSKDILKNKNLTIDSLLKIDIISNEQNKYRSLLRYDAYMGAVGTIVWGFGDIGFVQTCVT